MHKRLGNAVSPSGLWPFSAVSRNAFRPGEPRNGPESHFFFKDPISIWEKGNLGALSLPGASLLLGEVQEVNAAFGPPGARKTAETARFGPSAGKTESTAATPPKFASFYPLEFSGLIHKRPGYGLSPSGRRPFSAVSRNPFRPVGPRNGPEWRFRS